MKRNTRKGFTGIELVIVIAIIAILAASLIPAFGGLFDSANKTADLQGAREMDMAIKLAAAGEDLTIQEVIVILDEAGFDVTSLKPLYKHNAFYWNEEKDYIVLWDEKAGEVVYPEGGEMPLVGTEQGDLLSKGARFFVSDVASEADFRGAMENGTSVKLHEGMTTSNIKTPAGTSITIDLGGNTLSATAAGARHDYAIDVYGEVTLTNGTIDARGVQVRPGGKLILGDGVTVNAIDANGGAAIWVYDGGELEINGGVYTAYNGEKNLADLTKNPGVINNSGKVIINGGSFLSKNTACYVVNNSGELVINGGTFMGTHGVIATAKGSTTINGGEFTLNAFADGTVTGHVVYQSGGKVTINAGTFASAGTSFFYGDVTIPGNRYTVDGLVIVTPAQ